jgi:HlyD family secretion protein
MQAQSQVAADQSAVSNAEGNLAKLLSADASSVSSPPSASTGTGNSRSGTGSTTSGSGSSGGTGGAGASGSGASSPGTGLSGPGSTQTGTDGAAQLATDQATIDSAQAALVSDQQSLADAQLTSPIAGTVVSIGISPAQSISAGSTTDTITVINSGGYQVSSSLTPAQVSGAAVGDSVQVTVYGTTGPITGTVSRVGPVSTGSSSDTYPVIVALDPAASSLSAGSTAAVAIDSAQASNALVVPSSAVHTATPGRSYVLVLQAGKEKQARVTVGVVGDTYTQVTSGLTDGETVVLADPSMALPTSNATITGPGFGGGGFPGGTGGR